MSIFRPSGRAAAALACLSLFAGLGGISLNSPAQRFVLALAASFLGEPLPSHAQAIPSLSITGPSEVTEGEEIQFTISFTQSVPDGFKICLTLNGDERFLDGNHLGSRTEIKSGSNNFLRFSISTVDDTMDEEDGMITARIESSCDSTYGVTTNTVSTRILDNDGTGSQNVSFSPAAASRPESGIGNNILPLALHIEPPFNEETRIAYTIDDSSTAQEGSDFTISKSSPITIPANATRVNMPITIIDDAVDEPNETLIITIPTEYAQIVVDTYTNPGSPHSYHANQFKLTIRNDDGLPEVNLGRTGPAFSGDLVEGGDATFDIRAYPPPAADLPVSVTVSAVGDYGVTTGTRTVIVPAGSTSVNLSLSTTNDTVDEPYGSVTVAVTSGGNYVVGAMSSQTASIKDDDSRSGLGDLSLAARIKEERKTYERDGRAPHRRSYAEFTRALIAMRIEEQSTFTDLVRDGGWLIRHLVKVPLTVAEAQTYADRGWRLWDEIVSELKRLGIRHSNSPVPASSPPPQAQVNTIPQVNITSAAGGSEGDDVTFVITATPAPAAALPVNVAVTGRESTASAAVLGR